MMEVLLLKCLENIANSPSCIRKEVLLSVVPSLQYWWRSKLSVCACVCDTPISFCVPLCRGCVPEEDVTEFLNDGSWKRGINTNRFSLLHSSVKLQVFSDFDNLTFM